MVVKETRGKPTSYKSQSINENEFLVVEGSLGYRVLGVQLEQRSLQKCRAGWSNTLFSEIISLFGSKKTCD